MMLANELSGAHIGMKVEGPFGQSKKRKRKGDKPERLRTINIHQVYQSENLVLVNGGGNYLRPTDEVTLVDRPVEEQIPEVPEPPAPAQFDGSTLG
jgi:hypothetical protein